MAQQSRKVKRFKRNRYRVIWRRLREQFSISKLLFEFLFVCTAIFLGLYLNSIRERSVDLQKEKKYASSLYDDLKVELKTIEAKINLRSVKKIYADSLIFLLQNIDTLREYNNIYYYHRVTSRRAFLSSANPTIEQLKNTGQLNLFKSQDIVNTIISYEIKRKDIDQLQQIEEQILYDFRRLSPKILDAAILEEMVPDYEVQRPKSVCKIISKDKILLNEICCNIHYVNSANKRLSAYLCELKSQCENLIHTIQINYKLKD